jgi:UDP-N-acetylglucosamine 2-epimerase (non-hydrolysing)
MVVFGTRPEVIKLAPVVHAARGASDLSLCVVSTNQHTEMQQQMLDVFGIKPDHELHLMEFNQRLSEITERALHGLRAVIDEEQPDFILVQGDTTSAFTGALAGFYARVGVGHVEAGLRTGDKWHPYPEEMNRRLITSLADLHFAPTERARQHLLAVGVDAGRILVTGNTVVDALQMVRERASAQGLPLSNGLGAGRPLLVITAHRRESFGAPMTSICRALRQISERRTDVDLIFPVHLNPNLRETVFRELGGIANIHLLDPVDYLTMVALLDRASLILTDSGGIQEEAAALGRPVLVLRDKTERMEGVEVGVARMVGTATEVIVRETLGLLADPGALARMARGSDCYGDGRAAGRIVDAVRGWTLR